MHCLGEGRGIFELQEAQPVEALRAGAEHPGLVDEREDVAHVLQCAWKDAVRPVAICSKGSSAALGG